MKRKLWVSFLLGVVMGVSAALAGEPSRVEAEATKYSVYCANGKIEVDMRTFEQMKSARGSGLCKFGEFDYLSDALAFAQKQFGGAGAKCTCK